MHCFSDGNARLPLFIMSSSFDVNSHVSDRQLWLLLGHLKEYRVREDASYTFVVLGSLAECQLQATRESLG